MGLAYCRSLLCDRQVFSWACETYNRDLRTRPTTRDLFFSQKKKSTTENYMLSYLPATQLKQNASPHTGSSVFFLHAVFSTASSTVTTRYGSAFLVKKSAEYNLEHVQWHIHIVFCILQTSRFYRLSENMPKVTCEYCIMYFADIVLCILRIL